MVSEAKIFKDITFIVTSAVRNKTKDDEPLTFSKREVRQMIESRGGSVVDDLAVRDSQYFYVNLASVCC